jgi:hypothetical protein
MRCLKQGVLNSMLHQLRLKWTYNVRLSLAMVLAGELSGVAVTVRLALQM